MDYKALLNDSRVDISSLSKEDVQAAVQKTKGELNCTSGGLVNLYMTIAKESAKKASIPVELYCLDKNLQQAVDNKNKASLAISIKAKWSRFSLTALPKAKSQREVKDLLEVAERWFHEVILIKPNKTQIGKIIKWSSSKLNQQTKVEVVGDIVEAANGEAENGFYEYHSGAYTESTSMGRYGSYSLMKLDGLVLLRDDQSAEVYAFNANAEHILNEIKSREFDSALDDKYQQYLDDHDAVRKSDSVPF
ncbi:hypothetical protein VCHA53O466_50153 [Vibrio chagasii]|nr:hypothetical protein VCHA53O466_50153 [Vibrio chagasii]